MICTVTWNFGALPITCVYTTPTFRKLFHVRSFFPSLFFLFLYPSCVPPVSPSLVSLLASCPALRCRRFRIMFLAWTQLGGSADGAPHGSPGTAVPVRKFGCGIFSQRKPPLHLHVFCCPRNQPGCPAECMYNRCD